MDNNVNKNELNINVDIENKSRKIKTKVKKSNNTTINQKQIENQTIHQNYYVTLTTDKELNSILGITQNDIFENVKDFLKTKAIDVLKKAFEEISPLYLLTHTSKMFAKEQVEILVSNSLESSLRKQAILKIGLLTKQDIELLKILKSFKKLKKHLGGSDYFGYNDNLIDRMTYKETKLLQILQDSISPIMKNIFDNIKKFKKKYGDIHYSIFNNLKHNNIIENNENTNVEFEKMLFKFCVDSSFKYLFKNFKNKDDYNYLNNVFGEGGDWTSYFDKDILLKKEIVKLKKKIIDLFKQIPMRSIYQGEFKNCEMYWFITQIGETILKVI